MDDDILLVDDEEGIRTVLGISLADAGYRVSTAASGEEALELFRRQTPAIVLTDIKMPGMDGIELLRRIKEEKPDTEVIMITGHGDMELAIKSLKYQAVDFVTKPINDDILEIALGRAREKIVTRRKLREYTENLEALVAEKSARLIEAERQVAVGQALEGLAAAMRNIAGDLDEGLTYFNEMPCFVSIHAPDFKVVAANQLYRERLGDKVGRDSWEVFRGEAGNRDRHPSALTFKTGRGQRTRATVAYADGREVPVIVHTAPIRNREGEVALVVEISVDITEVKRLHDELQHSQKRYRQLFDEVPCYITVQDRDLSLTATNRRFNEDFGEAIGSHCYEIYKHRRDPCPDCPVEKTFADGRSHQSEMVVTSKAGERYNVLISTAPLRDAAGNIRRVMEMSTNITQIRQLQDHLSLLGLKIGSVSHGIKSLLTAMDGGIYLVDTGLARENPARVKEGWEAVKTITQRIRKLVTDILYFAKERPLDLETANVLHFAQDVAAAFEPKIGARSIAFECDLDAAAGECRIDPGMLRIALFNILENALDACVEQHRNAPTGRIAFSVRRDHGRMVFEVSDNGIGMDAGTIDSLFTLFFSSKGEKGTGMGLFIADRIVRQHGGMITVASKQGQGSTFRVIIPANPPKAADRQPA